MSSSESVGALTEPRIFGGFLPPPLGHCRRAEIIKNRVIYYFGVSLIRLGAAADVCTTATAVDYSKVLQHLHPPFFLLAATHRQVQGALQIKQPEPIASRRHESSAPPGPTHAQRFSSWPKGHSAKSTLWYFSQFQEERLLLQEDGFPHPPANIRVCTVRYCCC